jgi:hypothetical protein
MEEAIKESLIKKMKTVNTLLQEVSDTLGPDEFELEIPHELKLRIPRGYLRPAIHFRRKLLCVKDLNLKCNISYQLLLSDLFSWLLNRTDIAYTAREMLIKYEIVLMASIAETLRVIFTTKNISFEKGLERLLNNGKISPNTEAEICWLWKTRMDIHLFEIQVQEFRKYEDEHFNRAVFAVRTMLAELNKNCI